MVAIGNIEGQFRDIGEAFDALESQAERIEQECRGYFSALELAADSIGECLARVYGDDIAPGQAAASIPRFIDSYTVDFDNEVEQ